MISRWPLALVFLTALLVATAVPATPAEASCPPAGGSTISRSPRSDPNSFAFTGGGWGHGVGMSQYGARGAADLGCTAAEILQTYYTGTTVAKRTPASGIRVGLYPYAPSNQTGGTPVGSVNLANVSSTTITWNLDGASYSMPAGASWTVARSGGAYTVTQGTTTVVDGVPGASLRAGLSNRVLRIPAKNTRYSRGTMELTAVSDTRFRVTLLLPTIEQYLYGLAEMPMSWPQQALRAQAVAGRSYAYIARGSTNANCGCHIYDSVFHQVYRGHETEMSTHFPKWQAAVDATAERVLTRDGTIVTGHYASSHGGHSESAQYVWGGAIPHQQAVDDSRWELASGNPNTTWTEMRTPSSLGAALGIGVARTISVLSTGASGRVGSIQVVGSTATKTFNGEEFRRLVGLRSTLFTVLHPGTIQSGWTNVVSADLTGDGRDQLIFYRASDGRYDVHDGTAKGQPGTRVASLTIGKGWTHILAADLNGSGRDELIFYRASSGAWAVYGGMPDGRLGARLGHSTLAAGWSQILAADLDGDGDDELIFYRSSSGTWAAYAGLPDGRLGTRLSGSTIATVWSQITAADLDGDGDDELIFYRASDGLWTVYSGTASGTLGTRLSP